MSGLPRIERYQDFWPYYLRAHARPDTRNLHCCGIAVALVALATVFVSNNPWFVLVAVIGIVAPAWLSHFLIERNLPDTFRYPLWSLISDVRMAVGWVTGQLDSDLAKAGIAPR